MIEFEIDVFILQVFQHRMMTEYNVEVQLEPLGYSTARWVAGGWPAVEKAGKLYNCATVKDWVRSRTELLAVLLDHVLLSNVLKLSQWNNALLDRRGIPLLMCIVVN